MIEPNAAGTDNSVSAWRGYYYFVSASCSCSHAPLTSKC